MSGTDHPRIPEASQPQENCPWCWRSHNPFLPFPSRLSSSCCSEHRAWLLSGLAEKRERRAARKGVAQ